MLDTIHGLFNGFSVALQPTNILFCFLGAVIGTLVGVLPGIGPIGAMAILLPVTFQMTPISALIMLAGIYYGAQYGGSTTSILVNIPGEASSIVTCFDGYQMAKKGRAGPALGISAFGSFIAGTLGLLGLVFFAVPLSEFGLKFGPTEYCGVIFVGLTLVSYLSQGSKLKALMMAAFGLILGCVGYDVVEATDRMTFNIMHFWDGINMIPMAMGLLGISEILINVEKTVTPEIFKTKLKDIFPNKLDWIQSKGAILRGTVIGFLLGILPGGGPVIASLLSYGVEKRVSKNPEKFGKGAIEGVAGPEAANNAATSGVFVPLLTLGIPTNIGTAVLFGAFLIHGIRPGPLLLKFNPDMFWGLISSMYVGNIMLLILNLPLIPMWVQILKVPYRIIFPLILLFCLIGCYSLNNISFDVLLLVIFGIVGYLLRKFGYEGAPLILAFVLGPMLELNLRQSLLLSKGSFLIFFTRPISAVAVTIGITFLIIPIITRFLKAKSRKKNYVFEK